jgi:hypothetical protein
MTKLSEITFETVYTVSVTDEGFYIVTMNSSDMSDDEANVCCTEDQFNRYTFNDLCDITDSDEFYNYCCNHECSMV